MADGTLEGIEMILWKLEMSNVVVSFPNGYNPGVKWEKVK